LFCTSSPFLSLLLSLTFPPPPKKKKKKKLAKESNLHPLYHQEFHELYASEHKHPEFGPLLKKMKVVDEKGETSMDEDQWEAASKCSEGNLAGCCFSSSFLMSAYLPKICMLLLRLRSDEVGEDLLVVVNTRYRCFYEMRLLMSSYNRF
jgi:hypothetical protein